MTLLYSDKRCPSELEENGKMKETFPSQKNTVLCLGFFESAVMNWKEERRVIRNISIFHFPGETFLEKE